MDDGSQVYNYDDAGKEYKKENHPMSSITFKTKIQIKSAHFLAKDCKTSEQEKDVLHWVTQASEVRDSVSSAKPASSNPEQEPVGVDLERNLKVKTPIAGKANKKDAPHPETVVLDSDNEPSLSPPNVSPSTSSKQDPECAAALEMVYFGSEIQRKKIKTEEPPKEKVATETGTKREPLSSAALRARGKGIKSVCSACRLEFPSIHACNVHISKAHPDMTFYRGGSKVKPHKKNTCPHCNFAANARAQHLILQHRWDMHRDLEGGILNQCTVCTKVDYIDKIVDHMKEMHDESNVHQCLHCSEFLASEISLQRHMMKHSSSSMASAGREMPKEKKKAVCLVCARPLASHGSLISHMGRKHPRIPFFECVYCEYVCLSDDSRQEHVQAQHQDMM